MALDDIDIVWTHFLLLEEQERFAIIADFLFYTIAGPRSFVEAVLGSTVDDANREFLRSIVDEAFFCQSEKATFREVVAFYQSAAPRPGAS